jgi:aspartyl-tRNA(Asn)/glutamyl-tRNA(Gln) amidotransferase subunit B
MTVHPIITQHNEIFEHRHLTSSPSFHHFFKMIRLAAKTVKLPQHSWRYPVSSTAYRCLSTRLQVDLETGIVSQNKEALYQTIIGMEIHAQLDIPTKLFSPAPRTLSRVPNSCVHPLDLAVPGFLPVLSQAAVHAAVLTAAACHCEIQRTSRFERKHYFYGDLPLGYQMTQQRWPLARNGSLVCRKRAAHGKKKKKKNDDDAFLSVGIDRIQIEQDTGKTTTVSKTDSDGATMAQSLIDFNRAGCALVEIVFNPDVRSGNDAAAVLTTLRDLLKHIGTCDGRMEEGSLRCDLNVSVAPLHSKEEPTDVENPFRGLLPPGTGHRVEVKNLNSMKQVIAAAEYEAKRQAAAHLEGKPTENETRTFDVKTGKTVLIRSKEGAVDYRFTPEPDMPPLVLNDDVLDGLSVDEFVTKMMPELPEATVDRLKKDYGLPEDVAIVITGDPPAIAFYEEAVRVAQAALGGESKKLGKTVSNWLCNNLFGLVKEAAEDEDLSSIQQSTVSGAQLGELVVLIEEGIVSTPLGKKLLAAMYKEDVGKSPREISDERGWKVVSDMEQLKQICRDVTTDAQNESQLEQYKTGGKQVRKMTKFFVGKAMGASRGNAHPELLQEALNEVLEEVAPGVEE